MNNEAILTRQFYRPIVLSLHYGNTWVIIIHKNQRVVYNQSKCALWI